MKGNSFLRLTIDDQILRNTKLLLMLCLSFCIPSSSPALISAIGRFIYVSHFR
jgi:hypothetical protein